MKKKRKKSTVALLCVFLAVLIAAAFYVIFGVIGTAEKRVYPESEAVSSNADGSGKTVLDDGAVYQTIKGFGTILPSDNEDEDAIAALYDADSGIGLNICRLDLSSAVSSSDDTVKLTDNAQKNLAAAKKYAKANLRLSLFSQTVPDSIAKGSELSSKKQYESYANYLFSCAQNIANDGWRVTDIIPIPENSEDYTAEQARDLTAAVTKKFARDSDENAEYSVSAAVPTSLDGDSGIFSQYCDFMLSRRAKYVFKNKTLRKKIENISIRCDYSSPENKKSAAKYIAENYSSYGISVIGYSLADDDEGTYLDLSAKEKKAENGKTIAYGIALTREIIDDLTTLNAAEFDFSLPLSESTGSLIIKNSEINQLEYTKKYYCLGNFSKFIDENATRIACSDGLKNTDSAAFVNPDNETVVIYVNYGSNDLKTTLTIKGDYAVYLTNKDNSLARTDFDSLSHGEEKDISVSLPAQSVVTVTFAG